MNIWYKTMSTKIKSEAVLFLCITIKRGKKDMLASSGLTKHHNQGTYNMGKELNTQIFVLVQCISVYL